MRAFRSFLVNPALFRLSEDMSEAFFSDTHIDAELHNTLSNLLLEKSVSRYECLIWTGEKDRLGYGYLRVTHKGKRLRLRTHRLAFHLANVDLALHHAMHVSHLCHTKLCLNVSHLSYETKTVNNSRKRCMFDGECHGHHGFKPCLFIGRDLVK